MGNGTWEKFMGNIQTVGKGGACSMGKLKYLFFPRYVHTERFGAGPCMACDHAPKERKNYGKNTWEIWGKLGIGGKKIWEIWEKLGNLWEKKSEYGKNWVRFPKFPLLDNANEVSLYLPPSIPCNHTK